VPVVEVLQPGDCFVGGLYLSESSPDFKQGLPGRGARVEGEVGSEVQPDVEDAALREGIGPLLPDGGPHPGTAVTDHDQRGGDLFQERLPCGL